MIKILLVDDKLEVIRGWRMRLGLEDDMRIVGEAQNGETALHLAQETQPDIILLDLNLAGRDGIKLIPRFHDLVPKGKVIIVTIYDNRPQRVRAEAAGAIEFIAKQESPERLLTAIREAIHLPAKM